MTEENRKRLDNLCKRHHKWLLQCARNITRSEIMGEELVSSLYEYLSTNLTENLYYGADDINLLYCHRFLKTRWINRAKRDRRNTDTIPDIQTDEYDTDADNRMETAYNMVQQEIADMKQRCGWQSAMIWQIYTEEKKTLKQMSTEIGISTSTVFSHVEKVRQHLRCVIPNPFTYGTSGYAFTCGSNITGSIGCNI